MELSQLQRNILNKTDAKIVVMSSAASGKTALMTEKVRQILQSGVEPSTVAVITFTNMAAEELKKRLGDDYKVDMFVGTIHSLANSFLLSSGIDTSSYLSEEKFDKLFSLVKRNPSCVRPLSYVLLDEAQDTGKLEFEFIFDMIHPPHFFVCGDLKQSIYGFKGARPDLLKELSQHTDVATYDLNENYRNGSRILQFAKRIIQPTGLVDNSVALYPNKGSIYEMEYNLPQVMRLISQKGKYGEWAILVRTNSELDDIIQACKKYDVPYDSFKQGKLSRDELSKKLQQNTVKVLTIHSSKGLEWDNVCVIGARFYSLEERNVSYVAATRAKENLIWMNKPKKRKTKYVSWE